MISNMINNNKMNFFFFIKMILAWLFHIFFENYLDNVTPINNLEQQT